LRVSQEEWDELFRIKTQRFVVDQDGRVITTERGVMFSIPAGLYGDGTVVEIQEANTFLEMMGGRLTTVTTQDEPLVSAGMYKMTPATKARRDTATIKMIVPVDELDPDMAYFGAREDTGGFPWNAVSAIDRVTFNSSWLGNPCIVRTCGIGCQVRRALSSGDVPGRLTNRCDCANRCRELDNARWRKVFGMSNEELAKLPARDKQYYIASIDPANFPWNNLDKYLKAPARLERIEVRIDNDTMAAAKYYMTVQVNGLRGLYYPGETTKGSRVFQNILRSATVTLVAFVLADGVPHATFQKVDPSAAVVTMEPMQAMSLTALRERMQKLEPRRW
jgi:hypothetical protein